MSNLALVSGVAFLMYFLVDCLIPITVTIIHITFTIVLTISAIISNIMYFFPFFHIHTSLYIVEVFKMDEFCLKETFTAQAAPYKINNSIIYHLNQYILSKSLLKLIIAFFEKACYSNKVRRALWIEIVMILIKERFYVIF